MGSIYKLYTDTKEKKLGGQVHAFTTEGGHFRIKVEDKGFVSDFEGYLIHLSEPEVRKLKTQVDRYLAQITANPTANS